MSLLSWNCRGSGGPSTIPMLRRYLCSTGADLAFISETKCSKTKAERRIARLPLPNSEIVPSRGRGGGLWLLWNDSVSVSILESSLNFIIAKIQINPSAKPWVLFAVYGDCEDRMTNHIWEKIEQYTNDPNIPLCTIGDFNCILDQSEKAGGNAQFKARNKRFRSFVQRAGLIDLGHSGPAYTWANNQSARNLILERLDRGLAVAEWVQLYPAAKVFHLPNYQSDHLPVLLRTQPAAKKGVKPFRVEQWWSTHPDFKPICQKAVSGDHQTWTGACSVLRKEIKSWSEGNKDPNWELKKIEKEMKGLICQPQTQPVRDRIAMLQRDYQLYLVAQERYWLQRSRLN